jgi:hypothetical protein
MGVQHHPIFHLQDPSIFLETKLQTDIGDRLRKKELYYQDYTWTSSSSKTPFVILTPLFPTEI